MTAVRGPRRRHRPRPGVWPGPSRSPARPPGGPWRHRARRGRARPQIFGIEPNLAVLHQVVTAQLAAARAGTQSTKTRAEVRGGGAKPYRQKGTGHARQGSTRAPHFVGGGVALAPKPRSYAQRTPKKMVRLALRSALSDRAADVRVVARSTPGPSTCPETKDAVAVLEALGLAGRVLVVLCDGDGVAARSFATSPRFDHRRPASSTPTTCSPTTGWSSPTRRCRAPTRSAGRAEADAEVECRRRGRRRRGVGADADADATADGRRRRGLRRHDGED